jgi:hypothetical protein
MSARNRVLVLNSSYEILSSIEVKDAVLKLVAGTARTFESVPDKFIQGPPSTDGEERYRIPYPAAIVLKHYRHVDYTQVGPLGDPLAARSSILQRDGFCCMYCGEVASTIDHIHPQSKGGQNTWLNLVAACVACNTLKADKSLEESGLTLIREPFIPSSDRHARAQKRIWKLLESGKIDIEEM